MTASQEPCTPLGLQRTKEDTFFRGPFVGTTNFKHWHKVAVAVSADEPNYTQFRAS
jgi:hypothetical protein